MIIADHRTTGRWPRLHHPATRPAARPVAVAGAGVLVLAGLAGAPAASSAAPATEPVPASLTCQRMVTVPEDADMWDVLTLTRPGDCVQTQTGWVPPPPSSPARLTGHCTAVVNGTAPGRVQRGNGLGHLKGGDEVFQGDQTGSPPVPAPDQADVVFADPAYDTILDYGGDACLYGEQGADWIHAGRGNDLVDGGKGADTLNGGSGHDYVNGDAATAIPQRQDGSPPTNVDLLDGGTGDDLLISGFGVDEMYGGPGNDLCVGSVGGNPADNDAPPPGSDIWVSTGVDPEGRPTGSWLNKYHDCETIWTKTKAPGGLEALLVVDGTRPPESATGAADPPDDPCAVPPWARWQLRSAGSAGCRAPWPRDTVADSGVAGPHDPWPAVWSPSPVLPDESLRRQDAAQVDALRADLEAALATADRGDAALVERSLARLAGYTTGDHPTCGRATVPGTGGDDYLAGRNDPAGSDRIYGVTGDNRLDGFAGADCLNGGSGTDVLFGGKDGDVQYAGPGGDHVVGGAGSDLLYGSTGDDWLYGGTDDDVIDGGPGVNHCFGQSGHDVFINCQYIVSGLDERTGNWGDVARY